MATENQKFDFLSNLQQLDTDLVNIRGRFLVLNDQAVAQDLVNQITQEELQQATGIADKAALGDILTLLQKILELGGPGELTVLFNFKK